jgi:hypothetical protein
MEGVYWAVVTPLFARGLQRVDISEFGTVPLYPHKTPFLVAMSRVLSVFAILVAVMVTLLLLGLTAFHSYFGTGSILYLKVLVLLGYLLTLWTFLYPHVKLANLVKRGKERTLLRIRHEINRIYEKIDKPESADFELLKHLMGLHETVSKGPNTVISFASLRAFIGSIITPTIVAGLSIYWKSIFQKLID